MTVPTTNRRRVRRRPPKNMVKLRCQKGTMGLAPNVARTLLDVSTDGARLVITVPLESRQDVTLSLELPWQARPLLVPSRVRWCMQLADGNYCVGVHFDKTIPDPQVHEFAAHSGL